MLRVFVYKDGKVLRDVYSLALLPNLVVLNTGFILLHILFLPLCLSQW